MFEYTVKKLQVASSILLTPIDFYVTGRSGKKSAIKREHGGIDNVLAGKPATGVFERRETKGKERLA